MKFARELGGIKMADVEPMEVVTVVAPEEEKKTSSKIESKAAKHELPWYVKQV